MIRSFLFTVLAIACAMPSFAQSSNRTASQASADAQDPPRIRRWLDMQNVHLTSRFRWVQSNTGRITSSAVQWQPQVRGRVLLDPEASYTVSFSAQSGGSFTSGWNSTGAGLGRFAGDFNLKLLYLTASPINGLQLQAGGLAPFRGENTEITSYDNDAFLIGERVTVARSAGVLSQVVATAGHIGDYRTPNVFKRLKHLDEWNYGQLLVGARVGSLARVSMDYTYEDGRDLLREGLTLRLPESVAVITGFKVESYQRVSDPHGQGFSVSGDLRPAPRFTVTAGVAHVDRQYGAPEFGSLNADRFERGTRMFSTGNYALTREMSIGWFQAEAFGVDYPIPNERRWEVILTLNPTSLLKAKRVF